MRRDVVTEGLVARSIRAIPWSGVFVCFFVLIFFGVDLGAGIKQTARQIKQQKDDIEKSPELQKLKARQWSLEQVKNFREGDLPQPSWSEGGPRTAATSS